MNKIKISLKIKSFIVLIFSLSSLLSHASAIQIGNPIIQGPGCNNDNTYLSFSPYNESLIVTFDHFLLEQNQNLSKNNKAACSITIPIAVKDGYSISINGLNIEGYNFLPQFSHLKLSSKIYLQNRLSNKIERNYSGALDSNFEYSEDLIPSIQWTPCSQNFNLRLITTLDAKSETNNINVMSQISKISVNKINWRRCN